MTPTFASHIPLKFKSTHSFDRPSLSFLSAEQTLTRDDARVQALAVGKARVTESEACELEGRVFERLEDGLVEEGVCEEGDLRGSTRERGGGEGQ